MHQFRSTVICFLGIALFSGGAVDSRLIQCIHPGGRSDVGTAGHLSCCRELACDQEVTAEASPGGSPLSVRSCCTDIPLVFDTAIASATAAIHLDQACKSLPGSKDSLPDDELPMPLLPTSFDSSPPATFISSSQPLRI